MKSIYIIIIYIKASYLKYVFIFNGKYGINNIFKTITGVCKKMKKIKKKLPSAEKKDLKFLIEDFLEKEQPEISTIIEKSGDADKFWNKLDPILFKETFWQDEVDPEDKIGTDLKKLILGYHELLKSVWGKFREAIFDFNYRIILEREKTADLREEIEKDVSSVLYKYGKLLKLDSVIDWEKFYDIDIKITVSFDPGHVTFYKRNLDALNNFLDLLRNIPVFYFARCGHCGKCIILSRSDKRHCKGCAAKRHQKEKWEENPEGMKEREKERYHSIRK